MFEYFRSQYSGFPEFSSAGLQIINLLNMYEASRHSTNRKFRIE